MLDLEFSKANMNAAPKICTLVQGGRPYPGLPGLANENSTPVAVVSVPGIPLALAPRKEPVPARV